MAVRKRVLVMAACVLIMAGVLTGVGVHLWQEHVKKEDNRPLVALALGPEVNVYIMEGGKPVYFVANTVAAKDRYKELGAELGSTAQGRAESCGDSKSGETLCVEWGDGSKVHIAVSPNDSPDLDCLTMSWNVSKKQGQKGETPTDCFDMSKSMWFGAFEDHLQLWPMNNIKISSSAYVTGEVFNRIEYGEVIEPLFVSSLGMGIHVDERVPLYARIDGNLCFTGKVGDDTPFFAQDTPWLRYDVCRSKDIRVLWREMAKVYLPKPKQAPSADLVRRPIWSTWARYKSYINQSKAIEFVEQIMQNNMSVSQLEIDDDWTPRYGDFTFDTQKFPRAAEMVNDLSEMGVHTTVWMHPFVNDDSTAFSVASKKGFLVRKSEMSNEPALVDWWRGSGSGLIDFTNEAAVDWYLGELNKLKTDFNVTSFKFDAGEVSYLPKRYALKNPLVSPNFFTTRYVDAACRADDTERRQEVRVGFRSQECHTLVRMLDRASDWSHKLGLLTLIPTALASGLAGYPFVLPDMIGGNAYNASNIDQTVKPERELYIRWLQATLFMPVLQFSIAPWDYDAEVVEITNKMLQLRASYEDELIALMDHARDTGEPLVRPLWWADPLSVDALACESEFLMGDNLLVAPVLEKGARSRNVYLPRGLWRDEIRGVTYVGGRWLQDFKADLGELPHFSRVAQQRGIVG